jgi:hypothetical protein
VFSESLAEQIVPLVWREMEEAHDDPATWTQAIRVVEKVLQDLPIEEILTERYRASVDDLCGAGRWETNMGVGYWINIFPQWPASPIEPHPLDFHIDTKTSVDPESPSLGLVAMEFFTAIESDGGGTAIRVGSHRYVARVANENAFRLNDDELCLRASALTKHVPVIQVTPRAGDVLLMHPFTMHASSSNVTTKVRLAANRPISLFEPMNFHRIDSTSYSPVEWAVISAMNERAL